MDNLIGMKKDGIDDKDKFHQVTIFNLVELLLLFQAANDWMSTNINFEKTEPTCANDD